MKEILQNCPLNSPDLSPIENVWYMVQVAVDELAPSDKPSFIRCVKNERCRLPQKVIDRTVFGLIGRYFLLCVM